MIDLFIAQESAIKMCMLALVKDGGRNRFEDWYWSDDRGREVIEMASRFKGVGKLQDTESIQNQLREMYETMRVEEGRKRGRRVSKGDGIAGPAKRSKGPPIILPYK
jgi:hypothetical protein